VKTTATPRVSELYFEEIGEDFRRFMSPYDVSRRTALIESLLPERTGSRRALEVGCGTGEISRWLLPRVGELTVADISERLAREVGEELGCAWAREDALRLSFPAGAFDLVVSSECIEHTPDPRSALSEMARVLAPGGVVVVTTPNRLWYPTLLVARTLSLRKFRGNEIWLFPGAVRRSLRRSGLRILGTSGCHLLPWQVPFARRILPLFDRAGRILHPLMINFGVAAAR